MSKPMNIGSSVLGGSMPPMNGANQALTNPLTTIPPSFLNNSCVSEEKKEMIIKQIDELKYAKLRDDALMALSQQREHFSELAPYIWHSVGTIASLL